MSFVREIPATRETLRGAGHNPDNAHVVILPEFCDDETPPKDKIIY